MRRGSQSGRHSLGKDKKKLVIGGSPMLKYSMMSGGPGAVTNLK